jgi:uncharacterized protein YfaS (alpha-2-macroglobulin family)
MYTDRPQYRPTDTIDIFGVIMPRYGQSHSIDDVITLRFGNMFEIPVTLDEFDAFNISVPITNMFGSVDIIAEVNGERVMSAWVTFMDYTNLSFVLEGTLDKNAYFFDEKTEVEIFVTDFAGTPIDGLELRRAADIRDLVTDERGTARGTITAGTEHIRSNVYGWQPYQAVHRFSVVGIAQSAQTISFPCPKGRYA